MKKNLVISFSGGETSAYLCKWLLDNKSNDYNMIFIFANTGDEEEETLNFVNNCSTEWNINIIWVEALVNHKERISSKHKIVNFHTASRNREPFIEVIKKYGIPNQNFLHCNRELKLNPINSYIKSIGWENYETAIGIRIDEIDRVNINRKRFNLSYYTNCRTCWKKSDVVLAKIYKENPYYFEFNKQMELIYGKDKYVFFRRGRSTEKLIEDLQKINKLPIDKHKDSNFQTNLFNESCDIYSLCGK